MEHCDYCDCDWDREDLFTDSNEHETCFIETEYRCPECHSLISKERYSTLDGRTTVIF